MVLTFGTIDYMTSSLPEIFTSAFNSSDIITRKFSIHEVTPLEKSQSNTSTAEDFHLAMSCYFYIWAYPLTIVAAVVGLIITLITLRNSTMVLPSSTKLWLTGLLITNILFLIVCGAHYWLSYSFNINVRLWSSGVLCAVHSYATYSLAHLSCWSQAGLCVERMIVVLKPLKAKTYLTPQRTRIAMSILAVLIFSWNIPVYVWRKSNNWLDDDTNITYYVCTTSNYFQQSFIDSVDLFLGIIPPLVLMSVSTIVISVSLNKVGRIQETDRNEIANVSTVARYECCDVINNSIPKTGQKRRQQQSRNLSIVMIVMNVLFLITNIPMTSFTLVLNYSAISTATQAILQSVQGMLVYLAMLNNAFDWIPLTLSGAQFRHQFMHNFSRLFCRKDYRPSSRTPQRANSIQRSLSLARSSQ